MTSIRSLVRKTAFRVLPLTTQQKIAAALQRNIVERADDLFILNEARAAMERSEVSLEDRIRKIKAGAQPLPVRFDYSGHERLQYWIMNERSPWRAVRAEPVPIPGMLSTEEILYYNYIGRFYSGVGAVIELGPWLGLSTSHIIRGLATNPHFEGRKLNVFDDFVWRSDWMDQYVPSDERRAHHSDFQDLFEKHVAAIRDRLNVTKAKITDYDGNEDRARIDWRSGPIEIMYIDCGRNIQANQGWYDAFSPSFIPGVTLLIMQDWRTHRERPRKGFNQTKIFTDILANHLRLVHEVCDGGVATFLFDGL